jgi:hypothetical protein
MPAMPQTPVAGMKISLMEKFKMLIDSFLFNSYVRFLHRLLFLLQRLLFEGSFVVVQANIAAVVVSAVDDAFVRTCSYLHFQQYFVRVPISACKQNVSTTEAHIQYSTSAVRKLEE